MKMEDLSELDIFTIAGVGIGLLIIGLGYLLPIIISFTNFPNMIHDYGSLLQIVGITGIFIIGIFNIRFRLFSDKNINKLLSNDKIGGN
jgi:hypothetical protein